MADQYSEHIIRLLAIKAPKNVEVVFIKDHWLVECPRGRLEVVKRDSAGPGLRLKYKLMQVVKPFLGLIYPPKNVHRTFCVRSTVAIAALDRACDSVGLEPDLILQVEHWEVIKCVLAIPTPEYVHQVLVDARSMSESQLDREEQIKVLRIHYPRLKQLLMFRAPLFYLLAQNFVPLG